jgi:RimJ/RimL family protein N-acetyltransferase
MASFETERLTLEPWDERHRAVWRRICRDPEVMRFIALGQLWGPDQADDVFDQGLAHWRENGFGWRSALDKASGEWLGFVGLNYMGPDHEGVASDEVEIGWWLVRSAWRRGYATEGAIALRDEGFERIGLDRIIVRLQPANMASARVARRPGRAMRPCTSTRSTDRHGDLQQRSVRRLADVPTHVVNG